MSQRRKRQHGTVSVNMWSVENVVYIINYNTYSIKAIRKYREDIPEWPLFAADDKNQINLFANHSLQQQGAALGVDTSGITVCERAMSASQTDTKKNYVKNKTVKCSLG